MGTNRYAYAGNDPVNKSDPNGHNADAPDLTVDCASCSPTNWDAVQAGLDVAGMAGQIGPFADGLNVGISAVRGDLSGAAINTVAMVPGFGDAFKGFKILGKVSSNIDPDWVRKIHGLAQKTGDDGWHPDSGYAMAVDFAKDPNVKSVHLNQTVDTALGIKGVSKQRPDLIVVYKDGKTVHICECVSPSQTVEQMEKKMDALKAKIDAATGKKTSTEVVSRGGTNDPTGGKPTGKSKVQQAIDNGEGGLF